MAGMSFSATMSFLVALLVILPNFSIFSSGRLEKACEELGKFWASGNMTRHLLGTAVSGKGLGLVNFA